MQKVVLCIAHYTIPAGNQPSVRIKFRNKIGKSLIGSTYIVSGKFRISGNGYISIQTEFIAEFPGKNRFVVFQCIDNIPSIFKHKSISPTVLISPRFVFLSEISGCFGRFPEYGRNQPYMLFIRHGSYSIKRSKVCIPVIEIYTVF